MCQGVVGKREIRFQAFSKEKWGRRKNAVGQRAQKWEGLPQRSTGKVNRLGAKHACSACPGEPDPGPNNPPFKIGGFHPDLELSRVAEV